jgi:hypothetical protein
VGPARRVPLEVGIFVVWSNIADTVGKIPNDQTAGSYAVMGRTCAGASRAPDPTVACMENLPRYPSSGLRAGWPPPGCDLEGFFLELPRSYLDSSLPST